MVLATDINQEQIDHAASNPKIKYSVVAAEDMAIESNSIDLVTVACGVHWFDRERFYATARRVLVPNGVVAVWTYTWPWTGSRSVDRILAILKHDILGAFWPEESKLYLSGYTEMDFPFEEIPTPNFALEFDWKVEELVGFLSTWSVWQRYLKKNGCSPLSLIEDDLKRAWSSSPPDKPLHLPLHFRVGRSV